MIFQIVYSFENCLNLQELCLREYFTILTKVTIVVKRSINEKTFLGGITTVCKALLKELTNYEINKARKTSTFK